MKIEGTWVKFLERVKFLQAPLNVDKISYHQVIEKEKKLLEERRERLQVEDKETIDQNKFGIALSGGGIRSATINLGFLETLNKFGFLKRADYLSTVSGGGYTVAYIQAILKKEKGDYNKLFERKHINHMRNNGEYMVPGKGITKTINRIILAVGFLISLLMSWLSPFIIFMIGYLGYSLLEVSLNADSYESTIDFLFTVIVPLSLVLLFFHFILNVILNSNLAVSNLFIKIESALVMLVMGSLVSAFVYNLDWTNLTTTYDKASYYLLVAFALFVLGYFSNPNALSFHRFYRHQFR